MNKPDNNNNKNNKTKTNTNNNKNTSKKKTNKDTCKHIKRTTNINAKRKQQLNPN